MSGPPAPTSSSAARPPSTAELVRRFGLTRRQAEVALLLAQRLTNREIAERLVISPSSAASGTRAEGMGSHRHSSRGSRGRVRNM